jgi:hypothetical protein
MMGDELLTKSYALTLYEVFNNPMNTTLFTEPCGAINHSGWGGRCHCVCDAIILCIDSLSPQVVHCSCMG